MASNSTGTATKNIIWIFGDQHRAQALSCAGDPNLNTPAIDRLAGEGVHFSRAVAGCPLCCPFRGSLLTSLYPHQCVPGHEDPLPATQPTVAQAFHDAGYRTAWFGKWHLGGILEREGRSVFRTIPPQLRGGFDEFLGYDNNNSQWDCHVHGHDAAGNQIPHRPLPGYETDALTDLFIDYLRKQGQDKSPAAKPFFAVLSVQPPHDPYLAPASFMQRHNPARLQMRQNVPPIPVIQERARRDLAGAYAMIENLDHNIQRIRDALTQSGLADNTLILFFSDHGDMHGSQGQFRKTNPFEEAIRIPLIISGGIPFYNGVYRGNNAFPANHVDIAPTSLGLCGITPPSWMRGTDLSGHYLTGRPINRPDSAFIKLVKPTRHGDSTDRAWRGIVTTDGWKYVALENQPWLLFNLNEDIFELANHAHNSVYAAQRRKLQDRLAQWINDTGDAFALPQL